MFDIAAVEKMRVDFNGNVGIGTTAPASRLDVNGAVTLSGSVVSVGPSLSKSADGLLIVGGTTLGIRFNNQNNTAELMRITNGGNIGIGTGSPTAKLHVAGDAVVDGNLAAKYQDVAEWVDTPVIMPAGVVVVVDPNERNQVRAASTPYDTRVAGVVSARPGLLLGEAGERKVKVAHSGRVKVKVDASYGPIAVGDLLVTSATPGHAMRSTPFDLGGTSVHRPGTLLGKALEPLETGQGEILVLVTLQ